MSSDLPETWTQQPLENLCERVSVGHVGETSSFFTESNGIPFIRSQNVRPNRVDLSDIKFITKDFHAKSKKSQLRGGDLLIVRVGQNRGDCAVLPGGLGEVNCANIVFARPDSRYSDFFGIYFNTPKGHDALLAVSSGSAQLVLNTKAIAKIEVPVPPPSEAEAIGALGRAFDDRITLLRETNATLEAIAQALFKSWFVDFDPVRAKMEGRTPEGMDEATAALFPDGFETSELGEVPRGWRVMPVGDAIEAVGGATPDTKNEAFWEPPVHCWTSPKDLSGIAAPVLLDTERKVSNQGLAKIGSGLLPPGTLLMSSRAPIGYLALAQVPLAINQGYIAMLPGGLLPPLYMYFWCRQNMDGIKGRANGSTFMEISKKAFRPIPVLVPSPELMNAFTATADALFARLTANEQQAQTLSTLRNTLLPRLISGQLRLPEAASFEVATP